MISLDNITVRFGGFALLDSVSLMINDRDRMGLVGRNGAGKTTLLKIITGIMTPSEGKVVKSAGNTVGYLPQQMKHVDGFTVYDEAMKAFDEILRMEKDIERIGVELSQRNDYESDEYLKLIDKLSHLNELCEIRGGSSLHANVEKTLTGLGFETGDLKRQTSEFSGGWRMRIELAKILLNKPDIILLDEPTNHLDIESIQWLEEFLASYPGAVVLISHDKAFLDNVTNRTVEINLGKLIDYRVSYSKYVELRKERFDQQQAAYNNQQKMIRDTEEFIERFRYKATKAVQVQSRIKQLEKLERIEVEQQDNAVMNISFPPAPRSGTIVVEARDLTKQYGKKTVLNGINLIIERGEKVAFVGRNGEGKTTLSKIIVGEISFNDGEMKTGHNVNTGYYAQNQDELMDENKTVLETIDAVATGDIRTKMRDILGAFLFGQEDVDKKVKVLSGGERSRLSLARMLLQTNNLLVMDEPTNHLDIQSKDILKSALQKFNGTLILVSHDRDFLDGLVDKVYEFRNHKVREHIGGIYDFLKRKKLASLRQMEVKKRQEEIPVQEEKVSDNKAEYEKRKEQDRNIRKAENRLEKIEKEIEELENDLQKMDKLLQTPEHISDQNLFEKYGQMKQNIDRKMQEWENFHNELEQLKDERF